MSAELVYMNATDARVITDRMKTGVAVMSELIKEAYQGRVWELLRSGVLAAVRDGRSVKVATVELERYIRELPAYEPVA